MVKCACGQFCLRIVLDSSTQRNKICGYYGFSRPRVVRLMCVCACVKLVYCDNIIYFSPRKRGSMFLPALVVSVCMSVCVCL